MQNIPVILCHCRIPVHGKPVDWRANGCRKRGEMKVRDKTGCKGYDIATKWLGRKETKGKLWNRHKAGGQKKVNDRNRGVH